MRVFLTFSSLEKITYKKAGWKTTKHKQLIRKFATEEIGLHLKHDRMKKN